MAKAIKKETIRAANRRREHELPHGRRAPAAAGGAGRK